MICAKCSGNRVRHLPVIERLITQTEVTGNFRKLSSIDGVTFEASKKAEPTPLGPGIVLGS